MAGICIFVSINNNNNNNNKMELKFLDVKFFKTFRTKISNRTILIGICDNKAYVLFVESAKFARLARLAHH